MPRCENRINPPEGLLIRKWKSFIDENLTYVEQVRIATTLENACSNMLSEGVFSESYIEYIASIQAKAENDLSKNREILRKVYPTLIRVKLKSSNIMDTE